MSHPHDNTPSDPSASASARQRLRAWAETLPAYDVDRGLERLSTRLDDGGGGGGGEGSPVAAPKLLVAAVLAGVAIVGVWAARDRSDPPAPIASAFDRLPDDLPIADQPITTRTPVVAAVAIEAPEPVPAPIQRIEPRRRARPAATAPREEPANTPTELELVRRMRSAVATDPRRALAIGDELDRTHPAGVLAEERAALRVFALAASGDDERARTAGRAFLSAHANSPLAARVRRTIATREESAASTQ